MGGRHVAHRVGSGRSPVVAVVSVDRRARSAFETLHRGDEIVIGIVVVLRRGLAGIAGGADGLKDQVNVIKDELLGVVGLMAVGGFARADEDAISVGVISVL